MTQTFLAVASYVSNATVHPETIKHLYRKVRPSNGSSFGWDLVKRSLNEYLLVRDDLVTLRHASMGEALEIAARTDEKVLELVWRLVAACTKGPHDQLQLAGLQILTIYADLFGEEERGREVLRRFFDSSRLVVREQARLAVIGIADKASVQAALRIYQIADASWSDRMLLRLLLKRSTLATETAGAIVRRLVQSTDEQTRYLLAVSLAGVVEPVPVIEDVLPLLSDRSTVVRRRTFASLAIHILQSSVGRDELLPFINERLVFLKSADVTWVAASLRDRYGDEELARLEELGFRL